MTFPGSAPGPFLLARRAGVRRAESYRLYLYHWPFYLLINHAHTGLSGISLLGARLLATFAVATFSFFAIEEPIRTRRVLPGRMGLVEWGCRRGRGGGPLFLATVAPATSIGAVPTTAGAPLSERSRPSPRPMRSRPARSASWCWVTRLPSPWGSDWESDLSPGTGCQVIDRGTLGCELDTFEVILSGVAGPATPGCTHWRTVWKQYVDQDRPDVVGLLIGRWEVSDQLYHGNWVHIGQPAWDDHLASELGQAFGILTAGGARVIVFTMPYVDPPTEAATGRRSRRTPPRGWRHSTSSFGAWPSGSLG